MKEEKDPVPAKIIGATDEGKKLQFLVTYKNGTAALVDSKDANKLMPQLVIDFYESHIKWEDFESLLNKRDG